MVETHYLKVRIKDGEREREREKLLSIGRKPSRQNSCLILKSIQHRSRPLPFLLKYWHYSCTHPLPHPPLQETCTQHINPPTPIQQVKKTKTDQECIWTQKEKEKCGVETSNYIIAGNGRIMVYQYWFEMLNYLNSSQHCNKCHYQPSML